MRDKILHAPRNLDPFAEDQPKLDDALTRRINADPERVQRGLAQLVLTIVELLRQLMERQALRRIDGGTLTDEEVERLGRTFMELDDRMAQLREQFGLDGVADPAVGLPQPERAGPQLVRLLADPCDAAAGADVPALLARGVEVQV